MDGINRDDDDKDGQTDTISLTICLDDVDEEEDAKVGDAAAAIALPIAAFFNTIATPRFNELCPPISTHLSIAELPEPIVRLLVLRLNATAIASMRNWELVAVKMGMSMDEIDAGRRATSPMLDVLTTMREQPVSALIAAIEESRRADVLISLRPLVRALNAGRLKPRGRISTSTTTPDGNRTPDAAASTSSSAFISGLDFKQLTSSPPSADFILLTHHEPREQHKFFKQLHLTLKKWSEGTTLQVLDVDKCIDAQNWRHSLRAHFFAARRIVFVPSASYTNEVASRQDTQSSSDKVRIKRELHELMDDEYSRNNNHNTRFYVILLEGTLRSTIPIGWASNTLAYKFPEHRIDISRDILRTDANKA